jgi:hypothetical protein
MWAALATLALIGAAVAYACDQDKDTKAASASSGTCTSAAAAKCTAAQAAACKAHSVSATAVAASADGGCSHGAAATTAAAGYSCDHGAAATSAANAAGCAHGASATADGECPYHGAGVVLTSYSGFHGANANGSCAHGAAAKSARECAKHGAAAAAFAVASHTDCDACGDLAACEKALEDAGASTQIVPLKNGVMYVYTADTPSRVRAVQSALARRNDRMIRFASSGDKVHLCPECKDMRGTAASGKLSREIVNIEGGCLTVMTSSDPAVVARLYSMAGIHVGARTKS